MDWARILAYVTGMVDQELLARNEYLAAENRILKAQLKGRLKLSDAERATLGEIGHRLGRKILAEVANVARPDTILAWYRKLVARLQISDGVRIQQRQHLGEALATTPFRRQERDFLPQRLMSEIGRLPFRRPGDPKPAVSGHFRRVSTCRPKT